MDFDLNEEQRLLKDSIDGLLTDSYDFESRKKYMKEKGGWSKTVWLKLAEQGLLGLPFSEADGGFGGGGVETMIVMEALGKALVLEPYLATVVIGGGFLRHAGTDAQKAAHVPGIIDGSKTLAFAQLEKNSRYDLFDVTTTAKKKGDGWVIDGEKFVVLNGENADTLVVTARTKGERRDKTGIGVFLVPADAKGVAKKGYPTQRANPQTFEGYVHGLGHGVGLEIHEAPGIGPLGAGTLAAGMAVTVEPGVYLPGHGGVRIEDTLVVTDDAPELLTLTSKELLVL